MLSGTVQETDVLTKIENALIRYEISATRFGYCVAGDPALLTKMRRGRVPRKAMQQKIADALERLEKGERL